VVERFWPLCVVSSLSSPLVLSPPCPAKLPPRRWFRPLWELLFLVTKSRKKFLVTKSLRKIIKICLPINIYNNYRLLLCSRLFEESPAWFCSHLLAMIQACTHHRAIIVKLQQWPTPSESIAIYCVRKLVSCVAHRTRIIFTAGARLRTFAANPFNTWNALSKARMLTKPWLANLFSISK